MAAKRFLVFDFGGSNGKVSVATFNGARFEIDIMHRFDNVPVSSSQTLCWDIPGLCRELNDGMQLCLGKYSPVESMGIDAWGADFGFIDKYGKLISNPVCYRDPKRFSVSDELLSRISKKDLFKMTGGQVIRGVSSIFHLYELKKRKARQYLDAYKFLMMGDIFNYFLTGIELNEYTEATTSILVNQKTKKWAEKIIDSLDFSKNIFCRLIYPGEFMGKLKKTIADKLGTSPVPVVAIPYDTASAIAGFPLIKQFNNPLLISLGTWGIIAQSTAEPIINDMVFDTGFANEGGAEGTSLLLSSITGLWIIQRYMKEWQEEYGESFSWKDVDRLYPDGTPFNTFIDVNDPVFMPVNANISDILKKYCRENNQPFPHGVSDTARAIYENLVFKIKNKIGHIEKITKKSMDSIQIVGGGSKNKLFCQWLSDATGIPLASGPAETTSIGNVLMQLKAAGEIRDLKEGRLLSFNSSKIQYYEPKIQSRIVWETNYEKYLQALKVDKLG